MKKSILRFNIIVISIICLALLTACDSDKSTNSNGNSKESYKTLTITNGSMRPALNVGDVINYDLITESTQLKQYDIVVYNADFDSDGEKELHVSRIIEIDTDSAGNVKSYKTKGDNNNLPNDPILPENIVGIYVSTKSYNSN